MCFYDQLDQKPDDDHFEVFDGQIHFPAYSNLEEFLLRWKAVGGDCLKDREHFYPSHLDKDVIKSTMAEPGAIVERFYSVTGLPVITPNNCTRFIESFKTIKRQQSFHLWS